MNITNISEKIGEKFGSSVEVRFYDGEHRFTLNGIHYMQTDLSTFKDEDHAIEFLKHGFNCLIVE